MERLHSDAEANFEYCLHHEVKRGNITQEEADKALRDFREYEIGAQGGASGMLDRMSPSVWQPALPFDDGFIPEGESLD